MFFQLLFKERAEEEINNAYSWYEEQKSGLGEEFLAELDSCFEKITGNPRLFVKLNDHFRQAVVRRFPYVIVFEIHKKTGYHLFCFPYQPASQRKNQEIQLDEYGFL